MISQWRHCLIGMILMGITSSMQSISADQQNISPPPAVHRVYCALMDPREHPDYNRYHVKPPHWGIFGDRVHFSTIRGFDIQDNKIINYQEKLDKFTVTNDLGDVLWPAYSMLFTENLADVLDEIKQRNLFLFDIYGYVPGSGPGLDAMGFWRQFHPSEKTLELIEQKLNDHWLGMDNGEQDGRYVGLYARYLVPANASRREQYFNFQRHFERMTDELGNKMATLISLNFGHYFLKEGVYTLIGAETAQGLPNSQVYYAFIRGAGKQYGVPWFGNASVFNRWGFKAYTSMGEAQGYAHNPTKGTSLNLLKRLMYNHILYNCMLAGFEMQLFKGDNLSPIGKIQLSAKQWTEQYGSAGVMITPIALMTDFYAGWAMPRHLYTSNYYRVWGNLPYEAGDYLMDNVLDMFYPGYQNSSYYHDETGFLSATPYGDSVDCLLSDAPDWLLDRYAMVVIAGELKGSLEIQDKLQKYVEEGGRLVITAGSLKNLPNGLAGITVDGPSKQLPAGTAVAISGQTITEKHPFELYPLTLPEKARMIAQCDNAPAIAELSYGAGTITVIACPFGVGSYSTTIQIPQAQEELYDHPMPQPYPLIEHVRLVLDDLFGSQRLFDAGDHLSLITCRKAPGEYTLGICNNALQPRPLKITSHCGPIESIEEISLDQSEKTSVGYLPEGSEGASIGTSDENRIAGGDVRLFFVKVRETAVRQIPHRIPAPGPKNRILPLRKASSIKEEILARPTFFQHFDGVMIDWNYVHQRDPHALQQQAGWLARQKIKLFVDMTSGVNLYPDLRLINNIEEDYHQSMTAIQELMTKMKALGAGDLILSLHRYPENNFTREQTEAAFESTFRELAKQAEALELTLYLRPRPDTAADTHRSALELIDKINSPNLKLAASTALLLHEKTDHEKASQRLQNRVGIWLVAAPDYDLTGQLYTLNEPVANTKYMDQLQSFLRIAPSRPMILDGLYRNDDQEYLEIKNIQHFTLESFANGDPGNDH